MPSVGTLTDFRNRVLVKVGSIDTPHLAPSEEATDLAIDSGLGQYNGLRPRIQVSEQVGDGTARRFVMATLLGSTYDPDFSELVHVHRIHNRDTDDEQVDDTIEWEIRLSATDGHVLFINSAIATSQYLRTLFTRAHVIDTDDENLTTVPDTDTDLLTCLASSYVAFWIARKAGDMAITEMGITEINLRRIREHWGDRAKELIKEAGEFMSPTMVSIQSAGASVEWATKSQWSGRRISHQD